MWHRDIRFTTLEKEWCVMWIWSWSLSWNGKSNLFKFQPGLSTYKSLIWKAILGGIPLLNHHVSCASLVLSQGFGAPNANGNPSRKRWPNSWNWSCPPATVWSVQLGKAVVFEASDKSWVVSSILHDFAETQWKLGVDLRTPEKTTPILWARDSRSFCNLPFSSLGKSIKKYLQVSYK